MRPLVLLVLGIAIVQSETVKKDVQMAQKDQMDWDAVGRYIHSVCEDSHYRCLLWAHQGHCDLKFMQVFCCATCSAPGVRSPTRRPRTSPFALPILVEDTESSRSIDLDKRSPMVVYKDIFTGKEVFTDAFKYELVDDLYYVVYGTYTMEPKSVSETMFGTNLPSEEDIEGTSEAPLVIDIVKSGHLEELEIQSPTMKDRKRIFNEKMKPYLKKLIAKVKTESLERAKKIKHQITKLFHGLQPDLDKLRFFCGQGDAINEGGIYILKTKGEIGNENEGTPVELIVLKDGLKKEIV